MIKKKKAIKSRAANSKNGIWFVREKVVAATKWFFLRLMIVLVAIFATSVGYFYVVIPPFETILDGRIKGSVTLLDRHGDIFAWRGEQLDNSLRAESSGKYLVNAIISAEDKRFFRHFGVSGRGILGAMAINIQEGRSPLKGHGGSTITQQVAKLLCLMQKNKTEIECRRQSISRKILEIPFAVALELKFTKLEILSIYMNRVYLGASSIGFEAASQRYFGKAAVNTSLQEAAMLAALLTAPSLYAPTRNLELAQKRATLIINLMRDQKLISESEARTAIGSPARITRTAKAVIGAHFADWVMLEAPQSLTIATTEDIIVRTTFDPRVQAHIEKSVREVFSDKVKTGSKANVAVVALSAKGDVLGMLGGRKKTTFEGQYNRAFQSYRQPGSAFKPFVYAAAIEEGYLPKEKLLDSKLPPSSLKFLNYWPKNSDNQYLGLIDMPTALAKSVNTVAVQLAHKVGLEKIIEVANGLGIKSTLSQNLSLALGSSEVSLLNLTGAYAGFLNLGKTVHPRGWFSLSLRDTNETLIMSKKPKPDYIIGEQSSKALISMLVEAVEIGTGSRAKINGWQVAGKTGTSQLGRDAWFIGFSSKYIVGVWVGADDNSPLSGVSGGNLPAEIWSAIMKKIHTERPKNLPSLSDEEYASFFGTSLYDRNNSLLRKKTGFIKWLADFFKKSG